MAYSESGNYWRIERKFLKPADIPGICQEIKYLDKLAVQSFSSLISTAPLVRGCGLRTILCTIDASNDYEGLRQYPDTISRIPRLLAIFGKMRESIGSKVPGFAINFLEPGGFVEKHSDGYLFPSSGLTIAGISSTSIEDPVSLVEHNFDLVAGDRFVLQNPPEGFHPSHTVVNTSNVERVALIV